MNLSNIISLFLNTSVRDNFIANLLWWITLTVLTIVYLNFTNRLYPVLHKFFGKRAARIFRLLITIIIHPLLRIFILLLLLVILNTKGDYLEISAGILLISLSLFLKVGKKISFDPIPNFSDDFSDKDTLIKDWEVKTGNPQVEINFGKPRPALLLKHVGNQATNSFILLKKIKPSQE